MSETLKKEDLINDLIFLTKQLDEVWQYHPDNPTSLDPTAHYNYIKSKIASVESDLKSL